MQTRPFGNTEEEFPILSFGAQRIVDEHACNEEQAIAILNTAIDRGIRYFDTAWIYSYGQSEERVGKVAKHRRDEMWIATKVWDRTRDGALRQLEESLSRLQTDYVDEWRLHNIWGREELDRCFASDGAIHALTQAREEGLVRHLSISGHTDPQIQIEALQRFPFDSVLIAVSVLDHFIYSFAEEFLPVANAKGVATIGMKVFCLGKLGDVYDRALRYTLGLPVSTTIVGCSTMEELQKDLEIAEQFVPLSGPERLTFFREMLPLVTPQNLPWKAADWNNPVTWNPRVEPSAM
ncbi:MAG: aldo/keto reductase [Anaerolineae bacterium]|nr:aldo/keto reductase [Anaerolineae bacterium]NIN94309.1 aldo/keto reductase [Anaerolineae bacterium]NIQ77372.1 aldo/keto reductase [Anaerolineae bacterium]